ncbi:hypothetical protein M3Y94_00328300 [Aphelenchoides besseyi]|nr:hypothetical protein M3Y94_00328300 [Aphelenchoides besseyi]KAI6235577.1 hypothetical protein M3Y95_00066200 [Aphelenchoides besseyi]
MSVTTVSNQTNVLKSRRPNSTHLDQLDKLLETDLYEIKSNLPSPTLSNGELFKVNESTHLMYDSSAASSRESGSNEQTQWKDGDEIERQDSSGIYANLTEIENKRQIDLIDRQQVPPEPNSSDEPIRVMQNGWREYKTLGGRSFFCNSDFGVRQWQPPRRASNKTRESEPQRKQSVSDTFATSAVTSTRSDVSKSRSSSTDQPTYLPSNLTVNSNESITHVTNPLIEQELRLSNAHQPVDTSETFMTNRLPRDANNVGTRSCAFDHNYVNFNETGMSTNYAEPMTSTQPITNSSSLITTFPVLPVEMSSSLSATLLTSSMRSHDDFTPSSAIYQGTLEKCRLTDGTTKIKKNQWTTTYAFLYSGHLLFYRDQKSAEKNGKHYPPPSDFITISHAKLCRVENEKYKDKRHRQIISLQLPDNSIYLFSCLDTDQNAINEWFRALRATISSMVSHNEPTGSLGRSSNKSGLFKKQSTRHSLKHLTKTSMTNKEKTETEIPPRESIIDRLLRFLRSRTTMNDLIERGIYKPEPVFGSTLAAVCEHDGLPVPRFILEVTELIEKRGLSMDGIYRVSGNLSSIQKLRCNIDQDRYDALAKEDDVHVLTGALKLFLRELADPLFPSDLNKEFMSAMKEQTRIRLKSYDDLLKRLPESNRATLAHLISHLRRISRHSSENRMQIHNLAIVFGPAFFHTEGRAIKTHQRRNSGFSMKKSQPPMEPRVVPSQNLAYKMVVFGQITEFILNEADKFRVFSDIAL